MFQLYVHRPINEEQYLNYNESAAQETSKLLIGAGK